jgi:hypothetical protein
MVHEKAGTVSQSPFMAEWYISEKAQGLINEIGTAGGMSRSIIYPYHKARHLAIVGTMA